ncbi:MAG: hypothetical protein ACW981_17435 [Candidatus Hodarchaeales archaeon]|jgi:hypothetical protein
MNETDPSKEFVDTDTVSIVIETFNTAFENFDLPACIALTDSEGLALHTVGNCPDLSFLEGILAGFITAFDQMKTQINQSFKENPRGIAIDFADNGYYIYSIQNTELFLVARSSEDLIWRAIPFLKGICLTLDQINVIIEE